MWDALPPESGLTRAACAAAAAAAWAKAQADWTIECSVFQCPLQLDIPADKIPSAWENPTDGSAEPRSRRLDQRVPVLQEETEIGLLADGVANRSDRYFRVSGKCIPPGT